MGRQNNVAAVVVTYNRLELLRQCVEALRNQSNELYNLPFNMNAL